MPVVVYGFVEPGATLPKGCRGIDDARPRLVVSENAPAAALVGDLKRDELVARRRDLQSHMAVLAAVMERATVLPAQFGMVVADEDEVRSELLHPLGERLRLLLDRFENLVEMRLSAAYEEQPLLAEIVAEDKTIRRLRDATRDVPADHGLGVRLQLGELVAAAYEQKRGRDAAKLLERLEPLVEDEAPAEGLEWDLVTSSFLVRRSRLASFENEVERWARSLAGQARCELAGPMPPYSFVDLALAVPEETWA